MQQQRAARDLDIALPNDRLNVACANNADERDEKQNRLILGKEKWEFKCERRSLSLSLCRWRTNPRTALVVNIGCVLRADDWNDKTYIGKVGAAAYCITYGWKPIAKMIVLERGLLRDFSYLILLSGRQYSFFFVKIIQKCLFKNFVVIQSYSEKRCIKFPSATYRQRNERISSQFSICVY